MISVAIVSGLAAFWAWSVLNDEDGIVGFVPRLADKSRLTAKWLACPFCSGAWLAIAASVSMYHPSPAATIVTALAAAGITGVLGSYTAGE